MQYSGSASYDNKNCSSEFGYKYDVLISFHFFFYNMSFAAFVGAEGYQLQHEWIIKELTLLFSNDEFNHVLFTPPENYNINSVDLQTIRYTTKHLNGLGYEDGSTPYSFLHQYISKLKNCTVYCYGQTIKNFLQQQLPFTIIVNIQELNYKMPRTLPSADCGRNHNPRHCSLSKAKTVKDFIEEP